MEEIDSLQWNSMIDKRFTTQVIYPNHPSFKKMYDNYFKVYGLAFLHFQTLGLKQPNHFHKSFGITLQ